MVTSDSIPTQYISPWQDTNQPNSLKFGLYVKTHEMKTLEMSLRQITLLPRSERLEWVEEHQDFVNDLVDSFINDSALMLDGLQLDSEAMQLAIEFVTRLRDVMNMLRSIIDTSRKVTS